MNPFMMLQMFMGPFRFGCGCNSGFPITMPYSDTLPFLNFPIIRDTSYDYLLDPRLALQNVQMQMAQGGGFYGSTLLNGFTFPPLIGGAGGMMPGLPGINNPAQPQKTEEERKAEEKRKAEAEKPEAQKAKNLNERFNAIKKLAENSDNNLPQLSDELIKKADDAMKKETAKEQLEAMTEVFEAIPEDTLRKTILADSRVKEELRRAGYNFNFANNDYSLPNSDIKTDDIDHNDRATKLYEDITSDGTVYHELMLVAGLLTDQNYAKSKILGFTGAWNSVNRGKDKRLLRVIGENIPKDDTAIGLFDAVNKAAISIVNALLFKANEYKGCVKIDKDAENLRNVLNSITNEGGFTQANMNKLSGAYNKLSDAYDKLYVRLRMQEAVKVRNNILKNKDFKLLNTIKPGVLNNNLIVDETIKDLVKSEGFSASEIPSESELDDISSAEEITLSNHVEAKDADRNYKDKQQLVDEFLAADENKYLTKVSEGSNVYKTIGIDAKGTYERYFTVYDEKLVEVTPKADGSGYEVEENAAEVTAEDIVNYDATIKNVKELIKNKVIEPYAISGCSEPVFKATGANEFYIIKNNKLAQIVGKTSLSKEDIEALKNEDLDYNFSEADIQSTKKVEENKKKEAEADINKVTNMNMSSLDNAKKVQTRKEIAAEIAGEEDVSKGNAKDFKPLDVNGYFYCASKKRYYWYNPKTKSFVYLKDVVEISPYGYKKMKNGACKPCREVIGDGAQTDEELFAAIQQYGLSFGKSVSGPDSGNDYQEAARKLHTIIAINKPEYTYNFIRGYQSNCSFWTAQDKGICKQIVEESGFADGSISKINSKRYYISSIAKLILKFVDELVDIDEADYEMLERIANGDFVSIEKTECSYGMGMPTNVVVTNLNSTAEQLDRIIENVFAAYEKTLK